MQEENGVSCSYVTQIVNKEDQGAVYVRKDMLKECWPGHAEEPNMTKQLE